MKKLSLIIAFIIAFGNLAFAQKSKKGASDVEPPTAVLNTFTKKYKLAKKIVWVQEEENYRADFVYNDQKMATSYASDGKLLYTEKELVKAQHNKTALKEIQQNYAGYKVVNMRKRDTYDKKTTYLALLRKGKELLEVEFDKKGGFIRDYDKTPVSAKKKSKKTDEDEEEATDEDAPAKKDTKSKDDDEEETKPEPKKEKAKPSKKSNEDEDEDEEAAPAPKKEKEKPAAKPSKKSDDDEDEEETKPEPKKEKAKPAPKPKKKSDEDDEDE